MRWIWRARVPDPRTVTDPVLDGDTVRLEVDRGFDGTTSVITIRLKDVHAPETRQMGGPETAAFVRDWLRAHEGNWPFIVETFKTAGERDIKTFERYVGVVSSDRYGVLNLHAQEFVTTSGYPHGS